MRVKEKEHSFSDTYIKYFKKHHNAVYISLAILFILQLIILTSSTFQITKISTLVNSNINLESNLNNLSLSVDSRFIETTRKLSENNEVQEKIIKDLELLKLSKDFTSIAEKSMKSVVSIETFNKYHTEGALGTGFFITSDGYVVTNHHVIDGWEFIDVKTNTKETFRAKVIGFDDFKDVALLKIDFNSAPLQFADSNTLQIGQKVIAIGNPLGLDFSLSEGVISGLKRQGFNNLQNYIQTDVAINPGNSGGPLIDGEGKVVGLNTYKYVDQTIEGMGFALESNELKVAVNNLAGFKLVNKKL